MDDDINVQNGLAVVYELAKLMNETAAANTVAQTTLQHMLAKQAAWLAIFGIAFKQDLLDADVEALIKARNDARAAKDFAKSDEIRDELQAQGILLEDTAQGTRWRRK